MTARPVARRQFLKVGGTLAAASSAAALLAACSTTPSPTTAPAKPTEVPKPAAPAVEPTKPAAAAPAATTAPAAGATTAPAAAGAPATKPAEAAKPAAGAPPADEVNTDGFFTKPIGTGPFKTVSWRPDAEFKVEANTDYWGGAPGLKNLTFRDIREVAARVTALETGEIDLTYALPPDQLPGLRKNADLKAEDVKTFSYYFIWFNGSRKPFTDKRVRQALWHALDIDTLVKDLFAGAATKALAPIPSTVFGFAAQAPYAYDPAKAKQLLADAGLPNGFEATMIWSPGSGPQDRELAQSLLSYWSKVGVKIKSQEMEAANWLKDLLALNWDLDFQT